MIKCENLCYNYDQKRALKGISLNLESGKIIGLLGPNGSGKTTLIKILAGLLTPTSGHVTINDHEISVETKKIVSYLPEVTYLRKNYKIKDCVQLFADFYDDFNADKAKELIERLGIRLEDKMHQLSKGNKEKVQLILVMSREASVYLLDEPIGGVDPATRDFIINTILKNYNRNATVILSTHLIHDVEEVFDDVIFIKDGEIALTDSAENLRSEKTIDEHFREVFKCC